MHPRRHFRPRLGRRVHRPSRLWTFLNSNLGIWLLSAVFLYGTGASYAVWKSYQVQAESRRRAIEHLDTEIAYRIAVILRELRLAASLDRGISTFKVFENQINQEIDAPGKADVALERTLANMRTIVPVMVKKRSELPDMASLLTMSPNARQPSLYPEYSTYTLTALLVTLREQLEPEDTAPLDRALRVLLSLENDRPDVNARRLKNEILIPRWRQERFRHFFECSLNDPLCVARDNLYGLEAFSSDVEMNKIVGQGLRIIIGAQTIVDELGGV